MKITRNPLFLSLLALPLWTAGLRAQALLSSWYTEDSGRYARIYASLSAESDGTVSTTWSRGRGTQSLPTYAGVHMVAYSDDWVYIKTTGLASHIMGPWYLNSAKTNDFPNFPANTATTYRFPRNSEAGSPKDLTSLGAIGYFVNGVAMFDSRDAFSYVNASATDATPRNGLRGDGVWNRDAYINESVTFDAGYAHQAGPTYHYHANPPALRYQLGDHIDFDADENVYREASGQPDHSPIIGWMADGFPIYGPYGFADPNDPNSVIRRMVSGYQPRDGSNGTTALDSTRRTSLPLWASRANNRSTMLSANDYGPPVSTAYPLGHYIEDNAYKGDLGMTQGADFDLDEYNGRWCVTPEFPAGTYAYFTAIESDGGPAYPYNIGRCYYGEASGGRVNNIVETITILFEGGPNTPVYAAAAPAGDQAEKVVLVWNAVEGGTYQVISSEDLTAWNPLASNLGSEDPVATYADDSVPETGQRFYRVERTALDAYDSQGFE